ncbi:hypothetical protein DFH07DRAFT_941391 [Mycena maculata]|uniref:Uncharacterized protein n=1 Tax=Mycena maculata TaxID=230809 RepID=A0AAD7NAL7_9AGAR|nr:hypothetical protein DFH07DRAFT_941391 [Mycena maculata]
MMHATATASPSAGALVDRHAKALEGCMQRGCCRRCHCRVPRARRAGSGAPLQCPVAALVSGGGWGRKEEKGNGTAQKWRTREDRGTATARKDDGRDWGRSACWEKGPVVEHFELWKGDQREIRALLVKSPKSSLTWSPVLKPPQKSDIDAYMTYENVITEFKGRGWGGTMTARADVVGRERKWSLQSTVTRSRVHQQTRIRVHLDAPQRPGWVCNGTSRVLQIGPWMHVWLAVVPVKQSEKVSELLSVADFKVSSKLLRFAAQKEADRQDLDFLLSEQVQTNYTHDATFAKSRQIWPDRGRIVADDGRRGQTRPDGILTGCEH